MQITCFKYFCCSCWVFLNTRFILMLSVYVCMSKWNRVAIRVTLSLYFLDFRCWLLESQNYFTYPTTTVPLSNPLNTISIKYYNRAIFLISKMSKNPLHSEQKLPNCTNSDLFNAFQIVFRNEKLKSHRSTSRKNTNKSSKNAKYI